MNKQMNRKAASAPGQQPQTSPRFGAGHGYAFSADRVQVNAELELPSHLASGDYSVELWACTDEVSELSDPATGAANHKLASFSLSLPTPLTPITHRIEHEGSFQAPGSSPSYQMLLALVHEPSKSRGVVDIAKYPLREQFPAPQLAGEVNYTLDGDQVVLCAESITNPRLDGNLSGTLSLELWAFAGSNEVLKASGQPLAGFQLAPISGGYLLSQVNCRAAFKHPGEGQFQTAILLREWTENGYVTRDQRITANLSFAAAAPVVPVAPVVAAAPEVAVAPAVAVAPSDAATSAVEAMPVARALPSLGTASAEELAKVEGLNLRLAKELIKARPFRDWNDLLKVRGIGPSILKKLKTVASL